MTYKFITITPHENVPRVWLVHNKKSGAKIGEIGRYAKWNKLVLAPEYITVWSVECLKDVAEFIQKQDELLNTP